MKKGIKVLLTLLIISAFSIDSNAQLLKRLKNKATDRVKEKVNQKIDKELEKTANKMVDKTWESVFGAEAESEESGAAPRSLPFNLNSNVKTESSYSFDRYSEMEMISYNENGNKKNPTYMRMYFSKDENYSGTEFKSKELEDENQKVFLVYDYKNEAMLMLMDSEDGKVSFAYEWTQAEMPESYNSEGMETNPYAGYEELGTKTILGYECKGYRTSDNNIETEFWVTQEAKNGYRRMMNANSSTKYFQGNAFLMNSNGLVMEMTSVNKSSNEKLIMKMTKLDERSKAKFAMEDYPTIGMGSK